MNHDTLDRELQENIIIDFEQFMEYSWDYCSERIISDNYWEKNHLLIQELTFSLYRLYQQNNSITPRIAGKILEDFFSSMFKADVLKKI